jgi:YgiT-type zinc finger domain-containing protein
MSPRVTDSPFKTGDHAIVIIRGLPVLQCPQCNEFALADEVMARVDDLLGGVSRAAELEVIRYAA